VQRSLGDEVLIAIIAVAVIAFATAFGVILSLVTTDPIEPTAVSVLATLPPTATINFTPFATFTREASATSEATATPTDNPTEAATATPTLSVTVSPSATGTVTSTPSATDSPSSTPTVAPSDTATATIEPSVVASDTVTPVPTDTATRTPTVTATASPSPQPTASATRTSTATVTFTATSTYTHTATATVTSTPSITHTPTSTRTATRTATLAPTATPIPTITLIPTVTPTGTATSFPVECELPERWARFTVQPGDTLESLAAAAGVPVERVIRRNCLPDDVQLIPGDAVLLPVTGDVLSAPSDAVMGCGVPSVASIEVIRAGTVLRGLIEIEGTVGGDDFRRYRLEIRPDGYLRYVPILAGNTPVNGRVLGVLDAATLPFGLAWLRVVITTDVGTIGADDVCVIPVVIMVQR